MRRIFILAFGAAVILVEGGLWIHAKPAPLSPTPSATLSPEASPTATAAPTIGVTTVLPSIITVNTPTAVTITAQITDPSVIPDSVNLLRIGSGGTPVILGQLHDDGKNGDPAARDGIYTLQTNLNEASQSQLQFQVSAAFRGILRRVVSNVFTINVWPRVIEPTVGIQTNYPPGLTIIQSPAAPALISFSSSSKPVLSSGGKLPEGSDPSNFATDGFSIGIQRLQLSQPFSLNSWLATNRPYSTVDVRQGVTVSGFFGTWLTFKDEVNAGAPIVFVPTPTGSLYIITYTSTFDSDSPEEIAGLHTFQQILSSLVLQ